MSDLVLYEEDLAALNAVLLRFIKDAEIQCALLTNKEGQLLTCQGETESIDTTSVAALVTGSFAATVSIANLIGEREFKTMHHKGSNRHIHICLVDNDRYLATIFDNRTDVDKVSYYAAAYGDQLRSYLEAISGNSASAFLPQMSLEGLDMASEPAHLAPSEQSPAADLSSLSFDSVPVFSETEEEPAQTPLFEERPIADVSSAPVAKQSTPPETPSLSPTPELHEVAPTAPIPEQLPEPVSQPLPVPAAPSSEDEKHDSFFAPPPSNTAYLRIKIREAQAYRKKKGGDDIVHKIFGKKNR